MAFQIDHTSLNAEPTDLQSDSIEVSQNSKDLRWLSGELELNLVAIYFKVDSKFYFAEILSVANTCILNS
jgi:hypothetical protein